MRTFRILIILAPLALAACGTTHKTVIVTPSDGSTTVVKSSNGDTTVVAPDGDTHVITH
jgi:uncharacterized lipoprotein YajG